MSPEIGPQKTSIYGSGHVTSSPVEHNCISCQSYENKPPTPPTRSSGGSRRTSPYHIPPPHHVIPSPPVRIEESGCGGRGCPTFASTSITDIGFSCLVVPVATGMCDCLGNSPALPSKKRFLRPISSNRARECREPRFPADSLRVSLRKTLKNLPGPVGGNHQPSICNP